MAIFQQVHERLVNFLFMCTLPNVRSLLKTCLWRIYSIFFGVTVPKQAPPPGVQFRDGWLDVNGLATHVLTWGGWIEDTLPEGQSLLIFMCGIPGITHFYHNFLELFHILSGIPVWTICIAGQEVPPSSSNCKLIKDTNYNNVKAQTAHKLAFFKQYVPKDRKIYFVGHSFGSKMVIELLKDKQIDNQTKKSVLLMPTIERFRQTPRAQFWIFLWKTGFVHILIMSSWIVSQFPMSWQRRLALLYFRSRGLYNTHECLLEAMVQFWQPTIFNNARLLAMDELDSVIDLDKELLESQTDKMKVYFAPKDYWAPLSHFESLKTAVPNLPVEILDDKFIHAFTLSTAQDMAEILDKEFKRKQHYIDNVQSIK